MSKTLTDAEKQAMRDMLEKCMAATEEQKPIIAIELEGKGLAWQNGHTYGEIALAGYSFIHSLVKD